MNWTWGLLAVLASAVLTSLVPAQPDTPRVPTPFRAVDVYIDSGEAGLAAWQVEVTGQGFTLVGVEGGEHAAFAEPAHYDPAALHAPEPRVILGAFHTGTDVPTGRTRVARLHVQVRADSDYAVRLVASAGTDGKAIEAKASLSHD